MHLHPTDTTTPHEIKTEELIVFFRFHILSIKQLFQLLFPVLEGKSLYLLGNLIVLQALEDYHSLQDWACQRQLIYLPCDPTTHCTWHMRSWSINEQNSIAIWKQRNEWASSSLSGIPFKRSLRRIHTLPWRHIMLFTSFIEYSLSTP